MSSDVKTMRVNCPNCDKTLEAPVSAAGKTGRCPRCRETFPLLRKISAESVSESAPPAAKRGFTLIETSAPEPKPQPVRSQRSGLQPLDQTQPGLASRNVSAESLDDPLGFPSLEPLTDTNLGATRDLVPASPRTYYNTPTQTEARKTRRRSAYREPRESEFNGGVAGGLLIMLLAVVWFVGGLFAGFIFFYPPIMFVAGLVTVIKGLANFGGD